jgi:hypothetical protein
MSFVEGAGGIIISYSTEAEFMNVHFVEVSGHKILRDLRLKVSV